MVTPWEFWVAFIALVCVLLAIDLGLLNRKPHVISAAEALGWTGLWVSVALLFNGFVYWLYSGGSVVLGGGPSALPGRQAAIEFFTGYVVEESLSLDNIFVIALVFAHFRVPSELQHRVLFWGIVGALLMRGAMIGAGLALLDRFAWLAYALGALLLYTAVKMLTAHDDSSEFEEGASVRLVRRWLPVTREFHGQSFVVREEGKWKGTPLLLTLVVVEATDVVFAVDSIPAVFAVTREPFIVFTSNIFAILGLRSLYFALAAVLPRFRHLKSSLVFLLAFIGAKMLVTHHFPIPTTVSLAMIGGILSVGVMASIVDRDAEGPTFHVPLEVGQESLAATSPRSALRLFVLLSGATILLVAGGLVALPSWSGPIVLGGVASLGAIFAVARRLARRGLRREGSFGPSLEQALAERELGSAVAAPAETEAIPESAKMRNSGN